MVLGKFKELDINIKLSIIGLGYLGLPLARLLATKYPLIGFDINQKRVLELTEGHDATVELEDSILKSV
jgi:UDP-N-acetyl-D-galactosamine dehydrogenase